MTSQLLGKIVNLLLLLSIGTPQLIHGQGQGILRSHSIQPPRTVTKAEGPPVSNSYTITWSSVHNANYSVRLYINSTNVLLRQITETPLPIYNFTGLDDDINYKATVTAVQRDANGNRYESVESQPHFFKPGPPCRNGKIWNECLGHCPATCNDPDPICDRRCVPGCICPHFTVYHEGGTCIPPILCPAPTATFRPRNVRVLASPSPDSVILTWDPVPHATKYTVIVKLNSNRNVVVTRKNETTPVSMITSLTPGTEYLFVVTALIEEVPESRGFSTPPQEITISEVTHTSFVVTWELLPSATRYGIKIYGEDRTTELYSDAKIATKSAYISNLSPGTVYYVGIKSANRQQGLGPLSRLVGVRTNGPVNTDSERYWPSIVYSAPSTTTSTAATTTTAAPLTVCQQRYQSVVQFNRGSAVQRPLPNCDSDGNFVATVCPNGPSFCYCVVPETGVKRPGTEFGSSVNGRRIPLQCNRYGTFASRPSEVSVSGIESTRATVGWSAANGAFGYIIIVSAVGQTDKIYHVISGTNVRVTDLEPGKRYIAKVIAVNSNGIASQSVSINFMTTIVDKPEKLKITYSRMNKIMATWRIEDSATSYNVDLLDSAGQVVNSMQEIEQNNVEFTNLANLEVYTIRVRSVSRHFDDGGTERVYVSPSVEVSSLVLCSLPPIDVIFVFDISNRLTNNELTIVKNLFSDVLIALPPVNLAAPSGTRVAAVKYLPWVQNIFSFSRFNTTGNAVGAMKYSKWYGGNPNTNYMLDFVYTRYFASTARPGYSKRPSATSVVIVFSGGRSGTDITRNAQTLRQAATVIPVGVSGRSDVAEFDKMATRPSLKMLASSYQTLPGLKINILRAICSITST